jgi:hypothetical protein
MMIHQPMEFNDDQSSSDDELMEEIIVVFRENDSELKIFNRKRLVFFASKVFCRAYPHFGKVKNKIKNSFQKVVGSPWIHPNIKNFTLTSER